MNFKTVEEGRVKLIVPDVNLPEDGREYGFYNPRMKFDRNISVCVLKVFKDIFEEKFGSQPRVCDLLCATGVRGIRYTKEVKLDDVTINDINEKAIEVAKKNVEMNEVSVKVTNIDANELLTKEKFDVIDIDPFGSPFRFIDSAARSLSKFSLFCVTATDLPVLFGIYPKVCFRRYGLRSVRCEFEAELGLRILLTFVIRELAKYELAFQPLICYARKHWIRLFGLVERSVDKVDQLLKNFKYLKIDDKPVGDIYLGELTSKFFCSKVLKELKGCKFEDELKLVNMISTELQIPFYFDLVWIAKNLKKPLVKTDSVVDALRRKGFSASRTHFSSTGVKTDATLKEVINIIDEITNKKQR